MKKLIVTILVCALILFGTSFALKDTAAENARQAHLTLMKTLLPGAETFTLEPYAGEITMFVGVNNDGKVTGLVVYEAHETFGLGNQALTDHVFLSQFLNKSGSFAVATQGEADAFSGATGETAAPEGDTVDVDAITGATVTSKAVIRCVNSAVAYVTGADASSGATSWGG